MPLPYIPFADCMEVVLKGLLASQNVFMTFGVKHPSGINLAVMNDTAALIWAWYEANLRQHLSNQYSLPSLHLTDLTTSTGLSLEYANPGVQQGAVASVSVPNNVAMVVSLGTVNRGRSYRGRIYVPGLPAAGLVNATQWNASELGPILSDFATLQSTLLTDATDMVILSRFNGGVRRTVGVDTPVAAIVPKGPIGTQRRRVLGRGI